MSRGPGEIERRIGELFAATRDRARSVAEICDQAFELVGAASTRASPRLGDAGNMSALIKSVYTINALLVAILLSLHH
jgi:hypothetical protein